MLASELYALAHTRRCEGSERCHWCGGACDTRLKHEDPPPEPFVRGRNPNLAKFYQSPYMCQGCWLWRRERITVKFLDGTIKDRQSPANHSWFISRDGPVGIRTECRLALLPLLLKPPCSFCLMLLDNSYDDPPISQNHIHLAAVNDNAVVKADTPLRFMLNNSVYAYTVYELEYITKFPLIVGKEPGVQALARWMQLPPPKNAEGPSGRKYTSKVGNPKQCYSDPAIKAMVRMSGMDR